MILQNMIPIIFVRNPVSTAQVLFAEKDRVKMARMADLLIKFADDTKGAKEITCEKDRDTLQQVTNNLHHWVTTWGWSLI
jgi:hypothetical protein